MQTLPFTEAQDQVGAIYLLYLVGLRGGARGLLIPTDHRSPEGREDCHKPARYMSSSVLPSLMEMAAAISRQGHELVLWSGKIATRV